MKKLRFGTMVLIGATLVISPLAIAEYKPPKLVSGTMAGLEVFAGLKDAIKGAKEAGKALDKYEPLNNNDKRLEPNYKPPGTPAVPSKCYENKACKPCYDDAYGKVNITRKNLEKVRARYDFTHRFTTKGIAIMQGAANAGGGISAMGVVPVIEDVEASLKNFDKVVKNKNIELLGKLETNLREVAKCEAKFYKAEDWYDRYGYMYYQFMYAHYDYVILEP